MKSTLRFCLINMIIGLALSLSSVPSVRAAETSLATEAIVNLPVADAWQLFTSEAGLKSLGYTQVKVSLQPGGPWRASGGAAPITSLEGEILSLDPQHMLSFKPTARPASEQWSVLYFTAMGEDMTQLRWLEFFPETQRSAVNTHQQQVRTLFDQLIRRYAPECEVCKLEPKAEASK